MAGNESLGSSEQMWKVLKESVKNLLVYGDSKSLLLVTIVSLVSRYGAPGFVNLVYSWRRMVRFLRPMGQGPKMSTIFV